MKKINSVEPGSIAHELEIRPGDCLISVNGKKIADVLDYRFMTQEEELLLEIKKPDGEIWELEIEKDESEDVGIIFDSGLMDRTHVCCNRCIFCFIDQLPKGMRSSLYFKDDDTRLSFLSGNYVTLTNIDDAEAERIANYHLSPLHISVHAANPGLRRKMLGNSKSDRLFDYLNRFIAAGITMHFQIVLCKGVNDGPALDESIDALLALGNNAASLSVVPVGLSKYRKGLFPLESFSREDAQAVIVQVEKWQAQSRGQRGSSFVFCADEWYIKAGMPMPDYVHYEDFPQLENGVGMWSLFERDLMDGLYDFSADGRIGIVTGMAAQELMKKLARHIPGAAQVFPVRNDFFGPDITVSGLLTGRDVVDQVAGAAQQCSGIFLPENMFRSGTELTLDGMSRKEIEAHLGTPVWIGRKLR